MSDLDMELLRSWEGREELREDLLALTPARALAATLDHDPEMLAEGELLPPLYHWLYFPVLTKASDLATDGHAKLGGFMPPVPFPRRMFAGARVDYLGQLRIGERVQRVANIKSVTYKEGRSGQLVFVTVCYQISDSEGLKLIEEQDIAYCPATRSRAGALAQASVIPDADFSREIVPDEPLLFRFSALTFNAHRIHFDLAYALGEDYPALVVHGPLTAMLLADLVGRDTGGASLKKFSFRASSAFFIGDRISLLGKRHGDRIALSAMSDKGVLGLTAEATLR